ncbi:hypothetical protein CIG75_05900 [Tumebacillus algifaecis]|uniref:Uncharacterized protein n=1 Tax=Tumebacillus algifaecis TaxID=1214604 RepID=A0A223CZ03_9BACL|nr:hypothetical protein CIG75_05900 [Tumebacillus algifaecis]
MTNFCAVLDFQIQCTQSSPFQFKNAIQGKYESLSGERIGYSIVPAAYDAYQMKWRIHEKQKSTHAGAEVQII